MRALAAVLLAAAAGCAEVHTLHAQDIDLPPPGTAQVEAWKRDAHRGDPKQVAHYELQYQLDVPWKGELYNPSTYTFFEQNPEHPSWGSYVVRGYVDRSGRNFRYRVKVRQRDGVWYAVQISRFVDVELSPIDEHHHH